MGWSFSNLHICRTAGLDTSAVQTLLTELLSAQGYRPTCDPKDADFSVFICDVGGKWLSLCSDALDFYPDETIQTLCNPLSERLAAEILTISCFDSDCLLLNRVNHAEKIDAFAKIGHDPDIKIRSTPRKWKGLVDDLTQWKAVLGRKYALAEEALQDIEPLLGLTAGQGHFCDALITDGIAKATSTLYFSLAASAGGLEPPRCAILSYPLVCAAGKSSFISVVNEGGKTKGLAVAFSGPYVEHEDIRFRDVRLEYHFDRHPRSVIPLTLEKTQTKDGLWIWYAELPDFVLKGIKLGLPPRKVMDEKYKNSFGLRFTPEGNNRKMLDITVRFIPLRNPAGQCDWFVWKYAGSKRAYIEEHNRIWGNFADARLNPADYDIDD